MQDLQGKVAIITGSTSGIGKAAALTLAGYGVKVVISGRDLTRGEEVVAEIVRNGGSALFVIADLADEDAPERLVSAGVEAWERIDIVINNAALTCNKSLENVNHEDWNRLFAVNVKAAFFIVKAALPWLKLNNGNVINVSSINRLINIPDNLIYDVMKAALNHMTRGLSLDLRKMGIRVNAIMPGGTATPMLTEWLERVLPTSDISKIEEQENVASPQKIADVIVFLCSEKSGWINGAEIPLDGGYFLGG